MVLELSNYYLDVAKDRLYVRGAASVDRRRVLPETFVCLLPSQPPSLQFDSDTRETQPAARCRTSQPAPLCSPSAV